MELVALALIALIAVWVWLAGKQGTGLAPSAPGLRTGPLAVAVRRLWWQPVEEPVPRARLWTRYWLPAVTLIPT